MDIDPKVLARFGSLDGQVISYSADVPIEVIRKNSQERRKLVLDLDHNFGKPKQVIVIRKDLKMRRGKEIAQGCHASQLATENARIWKTKAYQNWINDKFTKICVTVDSEEQLIAIHKLAKEALLPCSLVCDSGLTEFGGVSTFTAVGIGPAWSEEIDKITGNLKLY